MHPMPEMRDTMRPKKIRMAANRVMHRSTPAWNWMLEHQAMHRSTPA